MDPDLKLQLSGSVIRLRQKSPYFAVLTSYLKPVQVADDSDIQTAATDSVHLFVNRPWFLGLTLRQRDGLLCHEVLHAALGHCWRGGFRHPRVWNIAADFVINLIVKDTGFELPPGGLYDEQFRGRSVEEVYDMIIKEGGGSGSSDPGDGPGDIIPGKGDPGEAEKTWAKAKANAAAVSRLHGDNHADQQLIAGLEKPQVDWRRFLWNELSFTPTDYRNYDRRFMCDEIYIEGLEPEETLLDVGICVDTSGSTRRVLGKFIAEVRQINSMYPNVKIDLYWQDTELIGPIDMQNLDMPQGGGGTDFCPYFVKAEEEQYKLSIFLTDGFGTFPKTKPNHRVIWVVCSGGLADAEFPFGEQVRILEQ